jgi:hypothetical protein
MARKRVNNCGLSSASEITLAIFFHFLKTNHSCILLQVDSLHEKDQMYYEDDPHTSYQQFVRLRNKGNLLPSNWIFCVGIIFIVRAQAGSICRYCICLNQVVFFFSLVCSIDYIHLTKCKTTS